MIDGLLQFITGPLPGLELAATHDPTLVALSYLVASFAAYCAVDLAGRVRHHRAEPRKAITWLLGGAFAMGAGIWCMHFVAMLAYKLPVAVRYDLPTTLLSLAMAIVISGFALVLVTRTSLSWRRLAFGGVVMGLGICSMHYTGMLAMRMDALVLYRQGPFALSVVNAIVCSTVALWLVFYLEGTTLRNKVLAALVMGVAICGMHYTGMYAAVCVGIPGAQPATAGIDPVPLAATIATGTLLVIAMILGLSLSMASRHLTERNRQLTSEVDRRVEAERHLRVYEEVIRSTGEAVVIADQNGTIIEVNPAHERVAGMLRGEALGTAFLGSIAGDDAEQVRATIWAALRSGGHWSGEVLDRRGKSETFPTWVTANVVMCGQGGAGYFVSVSRDITALKESEQQLQKLAFFDALTGLANRALLDDRMRVALASAARNNAKAALLYIDLDRFKYVNDTHGHATGDQLLVEIARRLARHVRATDTLARVGGDEFTILLTGVDDEADVAAAAERIIEEIRRPVYTEDGSVFVGASIGIALYPSDHTEAELLHKYADLAMYEAKQSGRDQFRRFTPDLVRRAEQRLALGARIEAALEGGLFSLNYQPIADLASGEMRGVEALIRWRQPDGSFIAPTDFIPHAEEVGLIKRIDCWVLEKACRDVAAWSMRDGRPIKVSVNVSAVSLQQLDLADRLRATLERTGLPASQLRLEITETAVIANPVAAAHVLESVSALGVGISLDDFGSGYSSLNYLVQFPIDQIKLDRSFIARIGKEAASEAIIRSLLDLAARLKMSVVAEGVEEARQLDFLVAAGCSHAQGYHIAMPLPQAEAEKCILLQSLPELAAA